MATTTRTLPRISITLTAYNMGGDATEADFDAWASYVASHIDEALGIDATVDQHPFRGGPADDTIETYAGCSEDGGALAEEVRTYLGSTGWEAFCSSSAVAA